MTKEELKQIYYINKEIKMWQKELENLQYQSLVLAQQLTGMPRASGCSDKVGEMATTIYEIEKIIQGKLAEIQMQRKKIMDYVGTIEESMMRQIVYLRCVTLMGWKQIAKELGGGNSAESIRQMYGRFTKE